MTCSPSGSLRALCGVCIDRQQILKPDTTEHLRSYPVEHGIDHQGAVIRGIDSYAKGSLAARAFTMATMASATAATSASSGTIEANAFFT